MISILVIVAFIAIKTVVFCDIFIMAIDDDTVPEDAVKKIMCKPIVNASCAGAKGYHNYYVTCKKETKNYNQTSVTSKNTVKSDDVSKCSGQDSSPSLYQGSHQNTGSYPNNCQTIGFCQTDVLHKLKKCDEDEDRMTNKENSDSCFDIHANKPKTSCIRKDLIKSQTSHCTPDCTRHITAAPATSDSKCLWMNRTKKWRRRMQYWNIQISQTPSTSLHFMFF